jgi:hypothetical protein
MESTMPAYATIEVSDIPLARTSVSVGVYRYQSASASGYEFLANVRVLGIQYREGPDAGIARFRYVFDSANPATDPTSFQDALSVDSDLPGVVRNDDRIVVFITNPDGTYLALFDGFAQVPELSLSPRQELVTFLAFGVAIREWDTPIGGALWRNADKPTTVKDVETDLLTQFNPQGQPNATPEGADASDTFGNTFPTFLDPFVVRNPDLRRMWTLPMAVRYLCYHQNASQTYVQNPDGSLIDSLLDSRAPSGGVTFLPDDPSSYTSEPIIVPDFPATGKAWPVALHELLEPNGFGMVLRLDTDDSGNPYTYLDLFRKQDGSSSTSKDLFLQLAGEPLDPAQSNLASARLARDTTGIANTITVDSGLVRYEASFILAPGFPISANDAASTTALSAFNKNDPSFSLMNRDKYRLYIFDETGEGHWNFANSSLGSTVPSLTPLLGGTPNSPPSYVNRRRIPLADLLSTDANLKPLKARIAISTNYAGPQPGLWDGSGTWQPVLGGFELLRDRLGIWINVSNPNSWNIGAPAQGTGLPYPAGVVKGVEDQALTSSTHFALRLTCVIEGDHGLSATADQRPSSSTSYSITRHIDATDRYFKQIIAPHSEFNLTSTPVTVRDDSDDALAEASARRLAEEAGEVAGSATIPRFTAAYRIGDKISSIQGRDLSLQTNAGAPTEEGAVFPSVVGISWEFGDRQQTTLYLSDRRGERR